jgi:hypothetical protein
MPASQVRPGHVDQAATEEAAARPDRHAMKIRSSAADTEQVAEALPVNVLKVVCWQSASFAGISKVDLFFAWDYRRKERGWYLSGSFSDSRNEIQNIYTAGVRREARDSKG